MTKLARVQPDRQIAPIVINTPGTLGINTVQQSELLPLSYCVQATNGIIDTQGRLSTRLGISPPAAVNGGSYTIGGNVFEYAAASTSFHQIQVIYTTATGAGAFPSTYGQPVQLPLAGANGFTIYDVTASATVATGTATGRWFFSNFSDGTNFYMVGFQNGSAAFTWNGTTWASTTSPTTNGVGTCAFGRIWACTSDNQTIAYSGLLAPTDWVSTSSGVIGMASIWTNGPDQVTAIRAFNAALVVFGLKHIVFFTDGAGSLLGLNPQQAYVFDVLAGTGCLSQWTVDHEGEADLLFLSPSGIQSLSRLQTNRDNPLSSLTKYVRDQLIAYTNQESINWISGKYTDLYGYYMLALPYSQQVYILDVRRKYQDADGDVCARVTTWPIPVNDILIDHSFNTFLFGNVSGGSYVFQNYLWQYGLGGQAQDSATAYIYATPALAAVFPWTDFSDQLGGSAASRIKILKRFTTILAGSSGAGIALGWQTDFGAGSNQSAPSALPTVATVGLFGIGLFGISTFGGSSVTSRISYEARASGQYYQLSVTVQQACAIQQIQALAKVGRTN